MCERFCEQCDILICEYCPSEEHRGPHVDVVEKLES